MEQIAVTRWEGEAPATKEDVKQLVRASGLEAMLWSGEAHKVYLPHRHGFEKTLWCALGSIVFHIDSEDLLLAPGDKMVLPAGTVHAADAGEAGVECYEAPPLHQNTTEYVAPPTDK